MICEKNNDIIHIRCAAHILNLVVQEAFDHECSNISIEKIRYFCKKIHSSSKLVQYLHSQTVSNGEPSLKVVVDVKTRWNSTHDMLKTAARMKKSISGTSNYIVQEKDSAFEAIDEADWILAQSLTEMLEPFYQGKLI